jgi:hypothetical protein
MNEAATRLREAVVATVLRGPGVSSAADRQAAFDNRGVDPRAGALVDKISRCAWTVTDADVAAVKAAGVGEDEIFELAVAAALGQATRQLQAALAAVDAAAAPETPAAEAAAPAGGGRP